MSASLIPLRAALAVADLLDNCARVQRDQHVLLLCGVDGLHGGRNLIDEQAIGWIQSGIQQRGAHASVLWTDMPLHPDVYWSRTSDAVPAWDLPPIVKGAMASADLVINHLIDYWTEGELRERVPNYFYNMATTAPLLTSAWALTPWELVAEIRVRSAAMVNPGAEWRITHPNGTDVRGTVALQLMPHYGELRYGPFPEGVFPSTATVGAEGTLVFDQNGPHWARHIGLPLRYSQPVRMTIEQGRVKEIRGGPEAEIFRDFFKALSRHLGDRAYEMRGFHGGAHPYARVSESECPDPWYRAFIEHHGAHSVHFHIGNSHLTPEYPFNVHVSAELQGATVQVGENVIYRDGRLTAFDDPQVRAIAARYPDRPGVDPGW
ncbi:MAG TPA: hypothetical protein VFC51_08490 [Chloroflexota bacterium]|nr:hypothetical protein [Chloroflexota bacterium]